MFTVRTAPHHTATAAWAEHRRREERERERRLWRRRQVRRAAALLAGVVLVVSAWRTLAWVGSFMRPVLPPAAGAVAVRTQNSMRVLALSVDFVDERVSLVDQTACFDPGEVSASRKCLEARAIERLSGDPVTTALPHNTPAYRKILCSALQSSFDRGVYEACVLEVLTARVLAGKK